MPPAEGCTLTSHGFATVRIVLFVLVGVYRRFVNVTASATRAPCEQREPLGHPYILRGQKNAQINEKSAPAVAGHGTPSPPPAWVPSRAPAPPQRGCARARAHPLYLVPSALYNIQSVGPSPPSRCVRLVCRASMYLSRGVKGRTRGGAGLEF